MATGNLKDELVYVGQAIDIKIRHNEHYSPARYKAQTINRALHNNKGRYDLIVLKECSIDDLDFWERTLIVLFNPKFNYTDGVKVLVGSSIPKKQNENFLKY